MVALPGVQRRLRNLDRLPSTASTASTAPAAPAPYRAAVRGPLRDTDTDWHPDRRRPETLAREATANRGAQQDLAQAITRVASERRATARHLQKITGQPLPACRTGGAARVHRSG